MSDERKHGEPTFAEAPPEDRASALQKDVEEIRDDLTGLVNELDRRRHAFFDVKRQISRHALPLALVGLGLVGVAAGAWALASRHRRRRDAVGSRAIRLRQASARMIDKPERVASSPTAMQKLSMASATAVISALAKRLASRAWRSG